MNTGWVCPRCGKVHAPFMMACDCQPVTTTASTAEPLDVLVRLRRLLREVADCEPAMQEDAWRMSYVEIQVDRLLWEEVQREAGK